MLTPDMARLIREQKLGFVATTNADGTPNLSPKGTFVVVDDATIAFAEIRSPGTLRNLEANGAVEVNFVDVFTRRGCRVRGNARIVRRAQADFAAWLAHFQEHPTLQPRARAVVVIAVTRAQPLVSPAYDDGSDEDALRRAWTARFRSLQPRGEFAD